MFIQLDQEQIRLLAQKVSESVWATKPIEDYVEDLIGRDAFLKVHNEARQGAQREVFPEIHQIVKDLVKESTRGMDDGGTGVYIEDLVNAFVRDPRVQDRWKQDLCLSLGSIAFSTNESKMLYSVIYRQAFSMYERELNNAK